MTESVFLFEYHYVILTGVRAEIKECHTSRVDRHFWIVGVEDLAVSGRIVSRVNDYVYNHTKWHYSSCGGVISTPSVKTALDFSKDETISSPSVGGASCFGSLDPTPFRLVVEGHYSTSLINSAILLSIFSHC